MAAAAPECSEAERHRDVQSGSAGGGQSHTFLVGVNLAPDVVDGTWIATRRW